MRTLYLVATPIGNLEDLSERAKRILQTATIIAAEDTRIAKRLFAALNLRPPKRLLSLRAHNEAAASEKLCAAIALGEHAAYIADAGTPGISDPGERLVKTARRLGIIVTAIPGASALTALLSVAGINTADGVHFYGFPPHKKRRDFFLSLRHLTGYAVIFESPHRIIDTVNLLVESFGDERRAVLGRELTKRYEQVIDATLAELACGLANGSIPPRGEFALLVELPAEKIAAIDATQLFAALVEHLPPRKAANLAAKLANDDKNTLYQRHMTRKKP